MGTAITADSAPVKKNNPTKVNNPIRETPPAPASGETKGESMEARIAKLESDISHIQTSLKDIKTDIRGFRNTWNTITVFVVMLMVGLFMWLDNKVHPLMDDSFKVRSEVSALSKEVQEVKSEVSKNSATMEKISDNLLELNRRLTAAPTEAPLVRDPQ